jgi:antitoxin component of RelBE/YafQ-DinJ toxin-antitoxin module
MTMNAPHSTEKDDEKLQVQTNLTLKAGATKGLADMQLDLSPVVNLLLAQIGKQNNSSF